jgi:hypothetical protein
VDADGDEFPLFDSEEEEYPLGDGVSVSAVDDGRDDAEVHNEVRLLSVALAL